MEHAMTEIVLDLLSLGRSKTNINPEVLPVNVLDAQPVYTM